MTLPSAETVRNWSGLTAVDSDDQPLGRITGIYLDHETGQPEWALVATSQRGRRTFVPLAGAARKGDQVAMAVAKAAVGDAPTIRPGRELSDGEAARLSGHYVGNSDGRSRGARRARGRGPVARLWAAAPPARSTAARLREAKAQMPEAGGRAGCGGCRWLVGFGASGDWSPGAASPAPPGTERRRYAPPGTRGAAGRLPDCAAAWSAAPVVRVARRASRRPRPPLA